MSRDDLATRIASGASLEEIARETGLHASTVGYWVKKFGLISAHAGKHAARGGLDRDELATLVAQNLTVREIAERLDRSVGTVNHWLRFHSLCATRAARRRNPLPPSERPPRVTRQCPAHGEAEFVLRDQGRGYRCVRCRAEQVAAWRRRVKLRLVEEAGGRCELCGYDRCPAALEFHHRQPIQKRFTLASRGLGRSLALLREEAEKCALLCSNCHAEVEAGYSVCPTVGGGR